MLPPLATALRIGAAALRANPVRTLLATLGVVIGAAALVAVLALGDGVERFARQQVSREGYDVVAVRAITEDSVDGTWIPRTTVASMRAADLAALAPSLGRGERAMLVARGVVLAELGRPARPRALAVEGIVLTAPDTLGRALRAGRHLTPDETRTGARLVVVSEPLARALAVDGRDPATVIGDSLRLGDAWVTIVGVTRPGEAERMASARPVLGLVAPLAVAQPALLPPRFGRAQPPQLVVTARGAEEVPALRARLERWLTARDAGWRARYRVATLGKERLTQLRQGILLFKLLMGAFTGITLVVGGIGIMNVLLASVAERTREIGVRKAVGARRRDILLQFLAESVTITAAGSAIGSALGLAAAYGVTAVMRAQTQARVYADTTLGTLLVAAGVAIAVGLVFGTYPALRAARLVPIEAMHTE